MHTLDYLFCCIRCNNIIKEYPELSNYELNQLRNLWDGEKPAFDNLLGTIWTFDKLVYDNEIVDTWLNKKWLNDPKKSKAKIAKAES